MGVKLKMGATTIQAADLPSTQANQATIPSSDVTEFKANNEINFDREVDKGGIYNHKLNHNETDAGKTTYGTILNYKGKSEGNTFTMVWNIGGKIYSDEDK